MSNARLQSHSAHMEKLFTEGLNSDITIELSFERFQNKQMKLHKLMLVQLPYFEVLLSGQWAEANQEIIKIKITDDNITERCKFSSIFLSCILRFSNFFQHWISFSKACILET